MSDDVMTFLLTGCASGIGRHLADVLVGRGHRVVATDADIDALSRHAEDRRWPDDRVHVRKLDVRDPLAWAAVVEETVEAFGRLDVLINNAGYLRPGPMLPQTPEEIHRQIDVNTKGVIFGTQAAARVMAKQGWGHIVNVGSFAALGPIPGLAVYGGSKYAVRGFSLAAALELRELGVHVTVVCPESVLTPMLEMEAHYDASAMAFAARRLLTVDDVADVILSRALRRRRKPLEVYLPGPRGKLARLMDLFPRTAAWLVMPHLRRKGLAKQRELRGKKKVSG